MENKCILEEDRTWNCLARLNFNAINFAYPATQAITAPKKNQRRTVECSLILKVTVDWDKNVFVSNFAFQSYSSGFV